jgi:hypothetical protein
MTDRTPKQQPQKPSPQYDRLLKGEITSEQYVKSLKSARSGRYVSRNTRGGSASA